MSLSISKRDLWRYVNIKIKRLIHHYHVFSVISILFEEMLIDLQAGKSIKIKNFGILSLKELPPRKYHDIRYHCVMQSPGYKILRFVMAKPIKKKLCAFLKLDEK